MFITLKRNQDKLSVEQSAASTAQGTRPRHAACTECRVKKLKCSGDRDGCAACLSSNQECTYLPPSRGNSRGTKRSQTRSRDEGRGVRTKPPSAGSRDTPTTRRSSSSYTASIEPDLDRLSWPTQALTSPETTKGFLDKFWKGSPASLEDRLGESSCSSFPDLNHELFPDYGDLPSGDDALQTHANDTLSALSSELFDDPSLSLAFPGSAHQHSDPSAVRLPPWNEDDPISFNSLTVTELSHSGDGNCRCMTDALIILDQLETRKPETTPGVTHTISGTLSLNKSALSQCNRVVECPTCQNRPGCTLLLILVCRNLVSQFQQLLSSDLNPSSRQSSPITFLDRNNAVLGQYSIDTSEEQLQVLCALAVVRGRSLALFIEKLKNLVWSHPGGSSHREKIESIESWHQNLMDRLKRMSHGQI